MNIKEIPLHLVEEGDRLRCVDEDKARVIAASMRELGGQLTPIEVSPADENGRFRLVLGAHRLRAVQINAVEHNGKAVISANIRKSGNRDEVLLREIDENLMRAELTPLDRAAFLAERKRIYLKLHPETARGGDRKSNRQDGGLISVSFSKATSQRIGLSDRAIQRSCALYENLDPEVRKRLTGTVFANQEAALLRLAQNLMERQREIVELLLDGGDGAPKTVKAAIELLDGTPEEHKSAEQAEFDKFVAAWIKYKKATKKKIVTYIANDLGFVFSPKGSD